ncbi:MAG: serine/threonine protein kinase [Oscillospiraceae bacterium]|nr:serine/threonine protein kinase [Oscillospiraceae bacterium]
MSFYIQHTDGVSYKLKAPFDFSFLSKYGKVFKVFDGQDSGNICFGVADGEKRHFVKFAGAPTAEYTSDIESAIKRLKAAVPVYQDLAHPHLIHFTKAENIGGGFAVLFDWVDAVCAHRMYPLDHEKFKQVPMKSRIQIFEDILDFHKHVAEKGYTAVDFYDGSIMWDFENGRTVICDIDFYTKANAFGNAELWGHMTRTASPEERVTGILIDEVSNVYNMGAIAFVLFTGSDRSKEKWPLHIKLYEIVRKAVNDERDQRQQSIEQLIEEWRAAKID